MVKRLTRKTLDRKAAKLCRLRAGGRCERCGSTQNLETSHFIGRTHLLTRWDERNLDCLCRQCHRRCTEERRVYVGWRVDAGKPFMGDHRPPETFDRIPTTKRLWMKAENARLDAALKEFE